MYFAVRGANTGLTLHYLPAVGSLTNYLTFQTPSLHCKLGNKHRGTHRTSREKPRSFWKRAALLLFGLQN